MTRPFSSIRSPPRPACAGRSRERLPRSARKLRKSHCGINAMNLQCVGRWPKSTICRFRRRPGRSVSSVMRQLREFVEEAKLGHHLERRRMHRVAAEVAEKIRVLLEHDVFERRRAPAGSPASFPPGRRLRCSIGSRSLSWSSLLGSAGHSTPPSETRKSRFAFRPGRIGLEADRPRPFGRAAGISGSAGSRLKTSS